MIDYTQMKPRNDRNKKDQLSNKSEDCIEILKEVKKKDDGRSTDYCYCPIIIFRIFLFRKPETILLINFFPLFFLSVLQLVLFWMNWANSDKLAICATILIGILSYQLVFRQNYPVTPETTLGDKHVFSSFASSFITALDAFVGMSSSEKTWVIIVKVVIFLIVVCLIFWKVYYQTIKLYWKYNQDFQLKT
jgi:hypothetical protein